MRAKAQIHYPFVSENLKAVPERLETLIADKKFLAASLILTRAIKTINKDEMMEIGALSDLRTYLISQQNVSSMATDTIPDHGLTAEYGIGAGGHPVRRVE